MDIKKQILSLQELYQNLKPLILERFHEFEQIYLSASNEKLFEELVFCLLTPQSKARQAEKVINTLKAKNLLLQNSSFEQLSYECRFVRFKNNKAKYILSAQKQFIVHGSKPIFEILNSIKENKEKRLWLFKNIKGFGLKESSHYLRNIGFGQDLAILDRHILKKMKELNLIHELPKTLTFGNYISLEEKLFYFSKEALIPFAHLDFVLWYLEAKEIFK